MKLLRQTIRQLIKESVCDSTNNKIKGAINILERDGLEVVLNNPIHWFKKNMSYRMEIHIYPKGGAFEADPSGEDAIAVYLAEKADGECLDAFITEWTNVAKPYRNKGLGALIYDIAIELSAKAGITSDRSEVSKPAYKNWKYMKKTRDTKKKPLDNQWGTYTPNDDWDNCGDASWLPYNPDIPYSHSDWPPRPHYEDIPKEMFQGDPLNNVYIKIDSSMPTVKCLEEKGLIRWAR
mgnify:CR=1 FL=1